MLRMAHDGEVGKDFADDRRKLEAMARAWCGDDDLSASGQPVQNEVAVRGHGVKAGLGSEEPAVGIRQMGLEPKADNALVRGRYGAIVVVRIDRLVEMVVLCDFQSIRVGRKSVEDAVRILQQEH